MGRQGNLLDLLHTAEMRRMYAGTFQRCKPCDGTGTNDRQWPNGENGCANCASGGWIYNPNQQEPMRLAA